MEIEALRHQVLNGSGNQPVGRQSEHYSYEPDEDNFREENGIQQRHGRPVRQQDANLLLLPADCFTIGDDKSNSDDQENATGGGKFEGLNGPYQPHSPSQESQPVGGNTITKALQGRVQADAVPHHVGEIEVNRLESWKRVSSPAGEEELPGQIGRASSSE